MSGPIIDEIGRYVFGPDIDHRVDEVGRRMIRRPLTETGRRLLGDYYANYLETMNLPILISLDAQVSAEITTCAPNWDLRKMVPRKFRGTIEIPDLVHPGGRLTVQNAFMAYLDAVSQVVNAESCRIDTLAPLVDVSNCPKRFLGHLAALIGFKLKNQELSSTEALRRQISMAVEMYKIKGTYDVLSTAFYMIGLNAQIWDLWTMDYLNFSRQAPHLDSGITPGFNPAPGLLLDDGWHSDHLTLADPFLPGIGDPGGHFDGGGGFKSSHFDIVLNLARPMLQQGLYQKLFIASMWPSVLDILEEYTPVNTVPHIYLGLYCLTKENFLNYTIPTSYVSTCITNSWNIQTLYFDYGHGSEIWLNPVLAAWDPTGGLPTKPSVGDRYLSVKTAYTWIENHIYQWNGAAWVNTTPVDLDAVIIEPKHSNWAPTHAYGVGDLVKDAAATDPDKMFWYCNTAHTSGSGTMLADRTAHPTWWDAVHVRKIVYDGMEWSAMDDDLFMDQDDSTKLQNITVFKVGIGNKGNIPNSGVTDLASIVYTGTVDSFQITGDKITFKMYIPVGVTLTDISELGLYHGGTGNLMIVSFFPAYDKPGAAINEITVDILRKKK